MLESIYLFFFCYAERLKHKQRRRAKKNQTMPMPANGHAARALSTEHVRPHDPNMADLFGADEVNGRHPHQPQELVRNDGRGDELAAADDLVHAVAAVPKESARNPLVETLGDLESDDNDGKLLFLVVAAVALSCEVDAMFCI